MATLQPRILCIYVCCVFKVFISLPPEALGAINSFTRNIGQDAIFMWNRTSGSIDEIRWGLDDPSDPVGIKPQFIYVNRFANIPVYGSDLDTPAGSSYKGRVHYVGDVLVGRAWFKITNLTLSDTSDKYAVRILEGVAYKTYKMSLTVAATPKFQPQPLSTKNIAEGQDLSVPCAAVGPPTPNVTWVQGHVIKSTGTGSATLRIPNIRRDQNGTYECQAWNNPNEKPVTAQTVVLVYYPPRASLTPASTTAVQGTVIILRCTADGCPPPSISWTKADGVIKAGHTVAGGTLRIPDAIKTDAGKYICTANNTYDSREHTDTASVTLTVIYQPSIIMERLLNQTLNESYSLNIKCDADGYPPPTIKWKTPTGSVHTGNVYNIPSVSRSDAGTYTCTASNGIGRDAMASIQVTVQYKPDMDDPQSSSKFTSWSGNSIRLKCISTGLPAPQISWYKPTNQQITTGVNIVPGGSEVTVLTTADQGDYGQYKCRAKNILGSDEHVINVTQLFSPGPVMIKITEIQASSIKVGWTKPADDGGSPTIGYLVKVSTKPPVMTVNTHAVITGLKANTQYTVKVYAQNVIGYGLVSTKVIWTTKIGRPGVPDFFTALHRTTGSNLLVILRWDEPDNNGDNIVRYTIYVKEAGRKAEWSKYDDVRNPTQLEYRIARNIVYGKTYMFMMTAWNKYGESVRDEGNAKTVNTTTTKATSFSASKVSCTGGSTGSIALGVIITFLVLSLCFNVLQFLFLKKRFKMNSRQESQSQKRKMEPKKDDTGESYENALELEDRVTSSVPHVSPARQPVHTTSEYESIQHLSPKKDSSTGDISNYQGLNRLPNTSSQGAHVPVYEPLRARSVEPSIQHDDQHPYEPLNIGDQNTTYQSLRGNTSEYAI